MNPTTTRGAGRDDPGPAVTAPAITPVAFVEDGDGGKQYAVVKLGAVEVVVCESLAQPGRVVVDVLTHVEPADVPLVVTVNDGYVLGGPVGDGPVDVTTREGRAIANLFATCTALGDDWSGGDVIGLLNQWFGELGMDVERPV